MRLTSAVAHFVAEAAGAVVEVALPFHDARMHLQAAVVFFAVKSRKGDCARVLRLS